MSQFPVRPLSTGTAVDLWLEDMDDDGGFVGSLTFLSADENARARRLRRSIDRKRFERGRVKLRELLGSRLSVSPDRVAFRYTERGKPELASPGGVGFSVSHSENLLLIGIGAGPFGLDVELVRPVPDLATLASLVFTPREMRCLADALSAEEPTEFFRFWTAKEAVMKGLGCGWTNDPHGVELRPARVGFHVCPGVGTSVAWTVVPLEVAFEVGGRTAVGALAVPGFFSEPRAVRIVRQGTEVHTSARRLEASGIPPSAMGRSPERATCG